MKKKTKTRIGAALLCAVMVAGQILNPANAQAENRAGYEEGLCEHHTEHTSDCGYEEAQDCEHTFHTKDCYKLICGYDEETDKNDTDSSEDSSHEHTDDCYELDCPHENGEHDDTCGYAEGKDCEYECDECNEETQTGSVSPEENQDENELKCTCTEKCTEGNGNTDCPVCSEDDTKCEAENHINADPQGEPENQSEVKKSEAVQEVEKMIDDLPSIEKIKEMDADSQEYTDAYNQAQDVAEAYEELSEEEQEQVDEEAFDKMAELLNYFAAPTTLSTDGCSYDSTNKVLTISSNDGFDNWNSLGIPDEDQFTLKIEDGVTEIRGDAFENCSKLTGTLVIPETVEVIRSTAFEDCRNLKKISFSGNNLQSIESRAFYNCGGLEGTLSLPDSVTTIAYAAFNGCTNLSGKLSIPNSVTTISESAFGGMHRVYKFISPRWFNNNQRTCI